MPGRRIEGDLCGVDLDVQQAAVLQRVLDLLARLIGAQLGVRGRVASPPRLPSPGIGIVTRVGVPCGPGMLMPRPGAEVLVGTAVGVGTGVDGRARPIEIGGLSIVETAQ